jgi:hypothetical protein
VRAATSGRDLLQIASVGRGLARHGAGPELNSLPPRERSAFVFCCGLLAHRTDS